jgi:hypothetical protein
MAVLAAIAAAPAFCAGATQDHSDEGRFLRVVEARGKSIALEVAARGYAKADGSGPEVCLVSVAHIGDPALYSTLQSLLDQYDVVLYESVKPPGAGRPSGDDDLQRAESTRESLRFVAGLMANCAESEGAIPETLDTLVASLSTDDPRLAQWAKQASEDAWGLPIEYAPAGASFTLRSLGADGLAGGDGPNADIVITSSDAPDALPLSGDDGLQAQLADSLGLAFQLEAVDYGREHFRCSDMTVDQLERDLAARGIDFGGLSGTLAGTSFSAQLVNLLLKLVKTLDTFFEGRVSDLAKLMMIEVLGNESLTDAALNQQFGAGFAEVIVGARNQIVMDDLAALIAAEPQVKSVAIFYGAAHMADFDQRLADQLDYHSTTAEWIPAMTLNLEESALSSMEIAQVRLMLRQAVRQMMRQAN